MKNLFIKLGAALLSFMIILSSLVIVVDEHYCGDTLVEISFFGKANSCGLENMQTISSGNSEIKQSNCCKDQKSFIQVSIFNQEKKLNKQCYQVAFSNVTLPINEVAFQSLPLEKDVYKDFPPPEIHQNFQILYQTFLI